MVSMEEGEWWMLIEMQEATEINLVPVCVFLFVVSGKMKGKFLFG